MEEKPLYFQCGDLSLEGLLGGANGNRGVVIAHPHPLYGGDMHNNVVNAIRKAYHRKGYTTLRFNFRGVGASHGSYDDGIGEQDDIEAAIDLLRRRGCKEIDLAGYSFGAWVIYKGLQRYKAARSIVMVSPPAAFLDFSPDGPEPRIGLVIIGSHDEIAPDSLVRELVNQWNPGADLKIIKGAEHFFWGREHEISEAIEQYLEKKVGEG